MEMMTLALPDARFAKLLLLKHACQIVFQVLVRFFKIRQHARFYLSAGNRIELMVKLDRSDGIQGEEKKI
jgi:hypothetical protein